MQFLICCEVRRQVYTFRVFVCLVFILGEGFFIYIYKHTHHTLEGLNLVFWSKSMRSKPFYTIMHLEKFFFLNAPTQAGLKWKVFPFSASVSLVNKVLRNQ